MAIAMMKRAVDDILDCVPLAGSPVTAAQLSAKNQALEWLNDEDNTSPTSFRGLCELFGLDPWEIMERLEQKQENKILESALPKTDHGNYTLKKDATEFLEKELGKFGHSVTVQVFSGGRIECSDESLVPSCKSLLGMRYKECKPRRKV